MENSVSVVQLNKRRQKMIVVDNQQLLFAAKAKPSLKKTFLLDQEIVLQMCD